MQYDLVFCWPCLLKFSAIPYKIWYYCVSLSGLTDIAMFFREFLAIKNISPGGPKWVPSLLNKDPIFLKKSPMKKNNFTYFYSYLIQFSTELVGGDAPADGFFCTAAQYNPEPAAASRTERVVENELRPSRCGRWNYGSHDRCSSPPASLGRKFWTTRSVGGRHAGPGRIWRCGGTGETARNRKVRRRQPFPVAPAPNGAGEAQLWIGGCWPLHQTDKWVCFSLQHQRTICLMQSARCEGLAAYPFVALFPEVPDSPVPHLGGFVPSHAVGTHARLHHSFVGVCVFARCLCLLWPDIPKHGFALFYFWILFCTRNGYLHLHCRRSTATQDSCDDSLAHVLLCAPSF